MHIDHQHIRACGDNHEGHPAARHRRFTDHLGRAVEAGTGGRTKWNRHVLGIPKTHALDAACVGHVDAIAGWRRPTLAIKCAGRGSYQRTRLDRFGFPRGYLTRQKRIKGFATGDRVIATVPTGKKAGVHVGRAAVRATGSFNIQTAEGVVQGVSHRYCKVVQRSDGYGYSQLGAAAKATTAVPSPLYLPGLKARVSREY